MGTGRPRERAESRAAGVSGDEHPGTWSVEGTRMTGAGARAYLARRIGDGELETWFHGDGGRLLCVVSNGARAMVMLLREAGDAGEHAGATGEEGTSSGYRLDNGQEDVYADADTLPLDEALHEVESIVATGSWRGETRVVVDR